MTFRSQSNSRPWREATRPHRRRRAAVTRRRGGALVEFVIVLPVMFLLIVGAVDVCNAIFLKQFLTEVSYQGAVEATRPGTNEERIKLVLASFLTARGIQNYTVSVSGLSDEAFDGLSEGQFFEVCVTGDMQPMFTGIVGNAAITLEGRSVCTRQ